MITDPATGSATIDISLRLQVVGTDKVVVPGCEPTTEVTSTTLSRERAKVCNNVMVDLQDALDAIPSSRVEFGVNWGPVRQRWFVLPPVPQDCRCTPDYYKILRDLPSAEEVQEARLDVCATVGQGFCPSGDFRFGPPADAPRPPADPYVPEGIPPTGPYGGFYTL